jgi:hypothetical protein
VVVLEDDIETSPGFLSYMNTALHLYRTDPTLMHIAGYLPSTSYQWILPSTFRSKHMNCWGWATWKESWRMAKWDALQLLRELDSRSGGRRRFDLDGVADFSTQLDANVRGDLHTWAIFWAASIYLAGGECLFPGRSLVRNIGTDGSGQHFQTDETTRYETSLADSVIVTPTAPGESVAGRFYLRSFYKYGRNSTIRRRGLLKLGRTKHRIAELAGLV